MNIKLTFLLLVINLIAFNLKSQNNNLSGKYAFGKDINDSDVGEVLVLQKSNDTLLVYLSVSKAAPSYSTTNVLTKLVVKNNTSYYKDSLGCSLTFKFEANKVKVLQDSSNCSFDTAVFNRTFTKITNNEPKYFYLGNGEQIEISENADIFSKNHFFKEDYKKSDKIKRKYILGNKEVSIYQQPNLNSKIISGILGVLDFVTDSGPPERITPFGFNDLMLSTEISQGSISEKTFNSLILLAIS